MLKERSAKQFPLTSEKHGPNLQNEISTNKRLIENKNESKVSRDLYQTHSTVLRQL